MTGYYYGGQFGAYVLESVPAPKAFKTYAASASRCSVRMPVGAPVAAHFTAVKDPVVALQGSRFDVRKKQTAADADHFSKRCARTSAVASRLSLLKIATVTGNLCRFSPRAKTTGNTPARLTARAAARRDILSRLALRAHANCGNASRFSMTARVGTHQVARHNAFVPPGWNLYARNTATGLATFLGFIPIDANPRELADVAIPDGSYEIEIRPAQFFWQNTRTRPITTLIANIGASEPLTTGIPSIQNLRAAINDAQTEITWNISSDVAAAPGLAFAVWFGPTSPVPTAGAPDLTVPYLGGEGEYTATRPQTATEYVLVAATADAGITLGPIAELFLPWSTDPEPSPPNQLAVTDPLP